jgi:hypothetical protein
MLRPGPGISWLPGKPIVLRLELPLPATLQPGQYHLAIGLIDAAASSERPVEFALKLSTRDSQGYYRVGTVRVSAKHCPVTQSTCNWIGEPGVSRAETGDRILRCAMNQS